MPIRQLQPVFISVQSMLINTLRLFVRCPLLLLILINIEKSIVHLASRLFDLSGTIVLNSATEFKLICWSPTALGVAGLQQSAYSLW